MVIPTSPHLREMSIDSAIVIGDCRQSSESPPLLLDDNIQVQLPDTNGNLPLHRSIQDYAMNCLMEDKDMLESSIIEMIHVSPDAVRVFNRSGLAPIHLACRDGVTLPILQALVSAWPDSIHTATFNKHELLPVHMLCRDFAGPPDRLLRIFNFFLSLDQTLAQRPTSRGDLPLHLYCRNSFCSLPIFHEILKAYPDAVKVLNNRDQLPIHIACEHQYVDRLKRKQKKSPRVKTDDADELVHPASSFRVIRYLASACPESLQVPDDNGDLALHAAIRGHQSIMTLKVLLVLYPEAINVRNKSGRSPLHLAMQCRVSNSDTIEFLLEEESSPTG